MSTRTRKKASIKTLAIYFAEHGIKTFREYRADPNRPVRSSTIKTQFNSYNKMLVVLSNWEPELYEMAIGEDAVAAAEKQKELEEALAAAASTGEGNEEDI